MRPLLAAALSVSLFACGGPAVTPDSSWIEAVDDGTGGEAYLDVAGRIPSFAGVYLEDGHVVVRMVEVASAQERADATAWAQETFSNPRVVIERADFTWRQLVDAKELLFIQLEPSGIYTYDADELANRVELGVQDESTRVRVRHDALRLGVDQKMLRVVITEPIRLL